MRYASIIAAGVFAAAIGTAGAAQKDAPADAGKREYDTNCAGCHGAKGRGDGPQAKDLKVKPADLAHLARNNGGVFPINRVYDIVDGRKEVKATASATCRSGASTTASRPSSRPNRAGPGSLRPRPHPRVDRLPLPPAGEVIACAGVRRPATRGDGPVPASARNSSRRGAHRNTPVSPPDSGRALILRRRFPEP